MPSPTQRSLAWCRENGYTFQKVEHWNGFARRRIDLFGFGDITAVKENEPGVLAIQTTTTSNLSSRWRKISQDPKVSECAKVWLAAGNRIHLHGWGKKGERGKRKTWQLKIQPIALKDIGYDGWVRID